MLNIENLRAGYPGKEILQDITLQVHKGELVVLVGPNGSGKSTLLKAVAGTIPLTGGRVQVAGEQLRPGAALAKRLAVLPQGRDLPEITAERMVLHGRFPHLSYPRRYRPEDYAIVRDCMAKTQCLSFAARPLGTLSGGERQRVYLAMVLAQATPVVLLDEPTTYLDLGHQLSLMQCICALKAEGKALLMVLHDLSLALRFADHIAVLEAGRMVAFGKPALLLPQIGRVFGVEICTVPEEDGTVSYYFKECGTKARADT